MARGWTHLISFVAQEDCQIHLGQPVHTDRDIGLDSFNGVEIKAYKFSGTIYEGVVTEEVLTVKQLLSPINRNECPIVRCIGLNYKDHATEADAKTPEVPVLFVKPRTSITGPFPGTINVPKCAQDETIDYEAELCVVIGKTGRDISIEDAFEYVLGYTAANDVSPRKLQFQTSQWSFAKGLDNCCPIGPVLVAPEVFHKTPTAEIRADYNGKTMQEAHIGQMIFSVASLISHLSSGTTLEAGSLILTGTPAGIGYFKQPRVYLEDGSKISIFLGGGIGTLVNIVRYQ